MGKIIGNVKRIDPQRLLWVSCFCVLSILFSSCSSINLQNEASEVGSFDFKTTDLGKLVVKPDDIKDIFPSSTYSISQENKTDNVRTFKSTFPVAVIEHTSSFSEGFETIVEIYKSSQLAGRGFDEKIATQEKVSKSIDELRDKQRAFQGNVLSPEGADIGKTEYTLFVIEKNILFTVHIRVDQATKLSPRRLQELSSMLLTRLQP